MTMHPDARSIPRLAALALLSFAAFTASGCNVRKALSSQCDLNSDCEDPYVCRLGLCRNWCAGDRDCPLGAYCAVNNEGLGSCLFPDEETCDPAAGADACIAGLACTPAGLCRVSCRGSEQCLWTGACIGGFCEDVTAFEADASTPLGDASTPRDAGAPRDAMSGCAGPELCNGMDDDCDGNTDEGADAGCDALPNATGE
ncbi:MAG: hypothetical protein AB7P00_15885, partial [Sandaracinaceae bacterium]